MREPGDGPEGQAAGGTGGGEPRGAPDAAGSGEVGGSRRSGAARARGGVRGRGTRLRDPRSACLNCGDPTHGEFCPTCGQRKTEILVSVRTIVLDALEDQFVLNRRLPRTLVNLFFRPGFLTVEHVHGRIARYVRPFKLYLVSSVIFFLLLSFFSLRALARSDLGTGITISGATEDTVSVARLDSAIVEIEATLADTAFPAIGRLGLERTRDQLRAQRERTLEARGGVEGTADTAGIPSRAPHETPAAPAAPAVRSLPSVPEVPPVPTAADSPAERPVGERRTLGEVLGVEPGGGQMTVTTGSTSMDQVARQRVDELMAMTPRQAIERLVNDFLNHIPTMMFVLLPFFALVLKVLYLRRRRFYAEHFVFLLHWHTFVYLIFSAMLLLRGFVGLPGWLILTLMTWTVLYIFIALKRVYGQGWLVTIFKGSVLGWSYVITLALAVPMALVISLLFL
jgi:hypothetical protein